MAPLEQLNALLASEVTSTEGEAEVLYTLPSLHETPDDRHLFRRLEAIQAFPQAWPAGEC